RYIPIGFLTPDVICSNKLQLIPDASVYHFGVLTSNVHMAWMRTVCGRREMRYDYSGNIVYNNFPWCNPTQEQKAKIEQAAQMILNARAAHPDCSLADLYDETAMPADLRKAHLANDKAVMEAYGFSAKMTESEIVAELMKMYQILTEAKA
ncbi:MAG: type IIL restriction-modification enzyme MmeI, partial [Acutalibacteraceae bacterium]|nr:type IIL restriction-modification enzyme MmeI [Acutalibacteraceae bacterium]